MNIEANPMDLRDKLGLQGTRYLPQILQTEAAECGLVCLTMISRFWGHNLDVFSLRSRFSSSLKGATLGRLIEIARELGFNARPLRLELGHLSRLQLPCVLHWDRNHFVVLKRISRRSAIVHDPAKGAFRCSVAEMSQHFTGIALELSPSASFTPVTSRQAISLRALAGETVGLKRALVQIGVLAISLEALVLLGPLYLQWVVDQVLVSADGDLLNLLGIGFLLVTVFQMLFWAAREWTIIWIGALLNAQWVGNLFSHLLRLPLSFFEKRHIGDVVSRFNSVGSIRNTVTTGFVTASIDGLLALITLGALVVYYLPLAVLVVGVIFTYACLRSLTYSALRQMQESQIVLVARQQTELLESIRGVRTLKLHNRTADRCSRFANTVTETSNREVAIQRRSLMLTGAGHLLSGLQRVVFIWIGARLVISGNISSGMLIAMIAFAEQFTARGMALVERASDFRMLRLHAERLSDIALSDPEEFGTDCVSDVSRVAPDIHLRNVSFRYSPSDDWILRNCSAHIGVGECVAITGTSGCGKSTLVKIILGLLEPTEGSVAIGGVDIKRLGCEEFRKCITAVMQDDQLFAGSIADNISFFDPNPLPLRIEEAARIAGIHDDIGDMPMGYQTLVGDMGSVLSGGQKQRVLLARAMYRKPQVLVLDEATSHVEVDRERAIAAGIELLRLTRIVVAHRYETLKSADRVLVLENGELKPVSSFVNENTTRSDCKFKAATTSPVLTSTTVGQK